MPVTGVVWQYGVVCQDTSPTVRALPATKPLPPKMARAVARVALYFDTVSPYTHLALHVWRRYQAAWPEVELTLKPMFLGGVMQASGNQPPGMLPARAAFMASDLQRSAACCGVGLLETPNNFLSEVARKIIGVQRVLAAAELQGHSTEAQL